MAARLVGDAPVGANGFPATYVLRAAKGQSKEVAVADGVVTAQVIRPAGVDGALLVGVMNTGATPAHYRFTTIGEAAPGSPGITNGYLPPGGMFLTVMLGTEDGVVCHATGGDTTMRFEFYNLDL